MSPISRRRLFLAASGLVAVAASPRTVFAQATAPAPAATPVTGPFTLPQLPYPTSALEPHIDAKTMEIHHDKHHAAYVNAMNTVAKSNPQLGTMPIENILEQPQHAERRHQNHRAQQSWRPRQSHHVLADHGTEWREAHRRCACSHRSRSRRHGEIPDRVQRSRRQTIRIWMGVRHRARRTASSLSRRGPIRTRRSWTASVR